MRNSPAKNAFKCFAYPWLFFTGCGLIGPLLEGVRRLIWSESVVREWLPEIIIFLWPTQPIAVIETSVGSILAAAMATFANLILFAIVGVLIVLNARRKSTFLITTCLLLFAILFYEFWMSGSKFTDIRVWPLLFSLVVYGVILITTKQILDREIRTIKPVD